jgi:Protein of unknown function (DUF2845)
MKRPLALVLLVCLPAMAFGQSLRCSNKVISFGTTQAEVANLCGDPAQVDHKTIYNTVGTGVQSGFAQRTGEIQVEVWTYNFGPNKLMQRIRFEDGLVVQIQSLGYGF